MSEDNTSYPWTGIAPLVELIWAMAKPIVSFGM